MYKVGVIVISDRAARGERRDACLPAFQEALSGSEFEIVDNTIVDDNPENVRLALTQFINTGLQLVFTSGGTGFAPRDNTPEVTREIIEKPAPGIDEAIRTFSRSKSPYAIYSRGVSGIAGQTLIINLPGSPRAVKEIVTFLLPTLHHPLKLIAGRLADCREDIER
ncbi:MAG: MogA/MoaB family molybdenum cofactor biosynthesis protein [Candidatus Zixiibacteriota bacterium]|nr:MAG: MogA/MoaB family molybdenum cofactor biosynthesis protein [candidate division Zixibacteria bacterium]